jgi:hypothetical protein
MRIQTKASAANIKTLSFEADPDPSIVNLKPFLIGWSKNLYTVEMKTFLFKLYNNVLVVKSRECHFKKLEDSG